MINLDNLEEILKEVNYPALYELEEGEMAEDAFKKIVGKCKINLNKKDIDKVLSILNDPMFMAVSSEQVIYDEMIKKTFGIPKIKN